MPRSRYRVDPDNSEAPHFLTCTIVAWLPVFARPDYMHNNPVARGYVDLPVHWRYSSARNYEARPGLIAVQTRW
jgi:hypothetical protein